MKEDWAECTLGDVLNVKNGFAFKSKEFQTSGIPVIRIGDIKNWFVDVEGAKCIEERKEFDNYIIERGDILIGMSGATTGKFGIYESELKAYQNQRVGNLRPYSQTFPFKKFILLLLYPLKRQIEKAAYGGAQPNISSSKIESLEISLPPLPEQRAIVSKIEQLFSELDNGIVNLKTAQQQLKVYRQAVLKQAFEGELTKGGGSQGWSIRKSEEVFDYVTSGSRGWAKYYSEKGSLFIRITNLNFNTLKMDLSLDKVQRVDLKNAREGKRTRVMKGDVLISITGYLGMTAVAPENIEEAYVNQHIALVRPKVEYDSLYLGYFLSSETGGLKQFNLAGRGATKAGLTLGDIKNVQIPVPATIKEQHQIVQEIESRLSVCDKLEESISQSLLKAEALRQSILKKAFEGRLLTEGELAACRKEKDWESAGVLLQRIKQEKTKKK